MSRKHFERIATELARVRPVERAEELVWEVTITAVAEACEALSPSFDRVRFLAACRKVAK